ncbi:MAG: pyridoxamine 5'-phosphate oxidase [Alphaproteobacteria bacterium]|nr:MAG: pyridoxamine 5'-phosphate oxidase [Caulobacteraceae bacterium]TPW05350.1 MAG: pyridoxamine 5'-phosphate oxidase [Alphaproteobacteria bacterium]
MTRNDLIPPSPSSEEYAKSGPPPDDAQLFATDEPLALFTAWYREAREKEPNDSNAMALATADADGFPDVRMVLLKDFDARGFTFYSNAESAKGRQLAANPQAALCFHWKSLRRSVRIRGAVSTVEPETADAYFASRDRGARIGAWASEQSRPLESRFALEKRIAENAARFGLGEVPRPPQWIGWRLAPLRIEFWRDRPFRLHDRLAFTRPAADAPWAKERLYP